MVDRPHIIVIMASQLRGDVLGCYGGVGLPGRNGSNENIGSLIDPAGSQISGLSILSNQSDVEQDLSVSDSGSRAGSSGNLGQELPPTATPALDRLAQQANVFDRHYTNCPLSIPARASFMSGLHTHQHGAVIAGWMSGEKEFGVIRPDIPLLPERFAKSGYHVYHAGVQQVRLPESASKSWDEVDFIGPTAPVSYYRELAKRGLYLGESNAFHEPVVDYQMGRQVVYHATGTRISQFPLREEFFYDNVLAQRIVDKIGKMDPEKPTALFVNFWLPHPPLWAPRQWAAMFNHHEMNLPVNVGKWFFGQPVLQLQNLPGHLGSHVSMERWQRIWAMYLGMVALLDSCVGKVIAALEQRDMFANAAVVFTADHGEMLGSHQLFGKGCMYEEVVRVPMILKMPGQSKARRIGELTDHLDLNATLLDLIGSDTHEKSPGKGLLSMATGGGNSGQKREQIFAAYDGNAGRGFAQRMIRTRTHKLIYNINDRTELYDMLDDPGETNNLSGREETRDIEATLIASLNAWMDEMQDDLPRCPEPVGKN